MHDSFEGVLKLFENLRLNKQKVEVVIQKWFGSLQERDFLFFSSPGPTVGSTQPYV